MNLKEFKKTIQGKLPWYKSLWIKIDNWLWEMEIKRRIKK